VAGLRGVIAGPNPLLDPDRSLVSVQGEGVVLEAVKPAESGDGLIIRLSNPTDEPREARIETGFSIARAEAVRLDETPNDHEIESAAQMVRMVIPRRALRTVEITPG
jgi:alpha-mannosidase